MSDEEPRSGSRWEPAQADQSWSPQRSPADQPTELHAQPHAAEADGPVAVAQAEHPAWTPPHLPPAPPVGAPRSGRGRRAIAAAIGAGLLLIGGAAGYAIGHATAASAATSGTAGGFGHGRGGPGGFRDGDGVGPGAGPGAGLGGTGQGNTGAGSGNTGTGSST